MTMPAPPASVRGQLVEHMPVHAVTFDIGTVPPPVDFRFYHGLSGPLAATGSTGGILLNVNWQVTQPGCRLVGYSVWCCQTGQDTSPVNFATWDLLNTSTGTLLAGATMTTGSLVQDQWNDFSLVSGVPLTAGQAYNSQVGLINGLPLSLGFWGAGQVGYAGIKDGPLVAFSDQGASNPAPFNQPQCAFANGSNDPTVGIAPSGNGSFNTWIDVLISTG